MDGATFDLMNRLAATQHFLTLRVIVLVLGERNSPPWWRTQFLTEAGVRATSRIFPRTAVGAAINSVSEAARLDHDRKIGVGRRYHLFRLPEEWEEALAGMLKESEPQEEAKQLIMSGREGLLKKLESLARQSKRVGKEGPISLGLADRIGTSEAIAELAANYLLAFSNNQKCYPYFEDQEGRA